MPSEFDYVEAHTEGEVDKWGFTIKPTISDTELILRCLRNAPCGSDKKQVERLIKQYKQLLLDHFTEQLDKLTAKELKELAARHT